MKRLLLFAGTFLAIIFFYGCAASRFATGQRAAGSTPEVEREFRAAWVATVANINWPSAPGLPVEEQKREAIALLDLLDSLNFNAVVFQVRPQCDALYASELEPWSYYLTGEQGRAPEPFYDPLAFWIEEAHNRGLELHAWLNPYRAHHKTGGAITATSIVRKRPDLVVELKEGYWWMDPAKEETRRHSTGVVLDIVRRYDVDGIHFDDYFYPYPSYNGNEDFPDDASWAEYRRKGGKLTRNDWRRESVNIFIKNLYKAIGKEKPHVKFGLSPFGIWRPGHPASIQGFDQYDQLYADARLWFSKGWVDYWTPQLYWQVNRIPQSFPILLGWWAAENRKERHFWPGISIGRDTTERGVDETLNQIMITRGMLPASPGNVHWSIGPLVRNGKLAKGILEGPYQRPALVPPSPWMDKKAPKAPEVTKVVVQNGVTVFWAHPEAPDVFQWVVCYQRGNTWDYVILDRNHRSFTIPEAPPAPASTLGSASSQLAAKKAEPVTRVAVSAVDRMGNESRKTEVEVMGQ